MFIETPYKVIDEPGSPAEADALTRDDCELIIAQRNEIGSRYVLIESLARLGRFQEALQVCYPDDTEKIDWINSLMTAETRDEEHRCKCQTFNDVADYARDANAEPVLEETPHYLMNFRHWSLKYNGMATHYKCFKCGCIQTLPDDIVIDEINAQRDAKMSTKLQEVLKLNRVR